MELNNEFEVDRPIGEAWALLTDVETIAPCLPGAQLEEIEGEEYRGSVKVKVGPITANYKGKARFIEKDDAAHKAVLRAEGRDARQGNANATITAQLAPAGSGTKVTVNTDLAVTGKVAQFGRGVMAEVSEKLLNQFVQNLETKVLAQGAGGAAGSTMGAAQAAAETVAPASTVAAETATPSSAPATPASSAPSTASATPSTGTSSTPAAAGGAAPTATVTAPATDAAATNGAAPAGVRKITSTEPVEPVDLLGATGAPLLKRLAPVLGALVAVLVAGRWLRRRRG